MISFLCCFIPSLDVTNIAVTLAPRLLVGNHFTVRHLTDRHLSGKHLATENCYRCQLTIGRLILGLETFGQQSFHLQSLGHHSFGCQTFCHLAFDWPTLLAGRHFSERHFSERHFSERHFSERHFSERHFSERHFSERHFSERHFSVRHFSERHFTNTMWHHGSLVHYTLSTECQSATWCLTKRRGAAALRIKLMMMELNLDDWSEILRRLRQKTKIKKKYWKS